MKILAIETSCDETAAAIIEEKNYRPIVLTNIIASQIDIHAATGGVIPDVAARMHTEALPTVLQQATNRKRLDFDAVAVTTGPGLVGSLLIGVAAAKTIALERKLPFFAINHLEGHVYSSWLGESQPELPALIVIVSGGHTDLVIMERHLYYKVLGSTRDDAAGEAFDKVARLLDLPYPGGPAISELAQHGQADRYPLPIPMEDQNTFDFSFSGLKAAVGGLVKSLPQPLAAHVKADIAASFQDTVSRTISKKVQMALESYPGLKTVCLVGGVAANRHLRVELEKSVRVHRPDCRFIVPDAQFCTDNAAMIGAAAVFRHLFGHSDSWYDVVVDPNAPLT